MGVMQAANAPTVVAKVHEIRQLMTERAASAPPSVDPVTSLFLIGSCSEAELQSDWYQDYDVHFLFDAVEVRDETLAWLGDLLAEAVARSDWSCKIEVSVRDRHWKMVPDDRFEGNIGIHATLLGAADHFRRLHYNPVLASNMYARCAVLHGRHPAQLRGWRAPSRMQLLQSVGGVAWLAENFARATALWCTDPHDRTFYPFIGGYCWNVASSLMFHMFTMETGRITSRGGAFEWFMGLGGISGDERAAADLLHASREDPRDDARFAHSAIDAAGLVLNVARRMTWEWVGPDKWLPAGSCSVQAPAVLAREERFVGVPEILGVAGDSLPALDLRRPSSPNGYLDSIQTTLELARAEAGPIFSVKEDFELLRDVESRGKPLVKVRIWDEASECRRRLSHDYDFANSRPSEAAALWGWETGAQALLQRIHEVLFERRGLDPATTDGLARAACAIVEQQMRAIGYEGLALRADHARGATRSLAELLERHVPLVGA